VFACVLDVSAETLKGWEQGKKRTRGPARRLLQVMAKHPDLVEELTRELAEAVKCRMFCSFVGYSGSV
jgi:hypothetical protein